MHLQPKKLFLKLINWMFLFLFRPAMEDHPFFLIFNKLFNLIQIQTKLKKLRIYLPLPRFLNTKNTKQK